MTDAVTAGGSDQILDTDNAIFKKNGEAVWRVQVPIRSLQLDEIFTFLKKIKAWMPGVASFADGRCSLEAPPKMQARYRMMGAIIRFVQGEKPLTKLDINWGTLVATPEGGMAALGVARTALKVVIFDDSFLGPNWTVEMVNAAIEYGMHLYPPG